MSKWFFGQIVLVTILATLLGNTQLLPKLLDIWTPYMEKIERHRGAGVITMLADELNLVAADKQAALLGQLQTEFGYVIRLKKLAAVKLSAGKLAKVHSGEVVFDRGSLQLIKLLEDGHNVIVIENMELPAAHINSGLSLGITRSIALLKDLLASTDESLWQALITRVATVEGVPVAINATLSLALSDSEKAMLHRAGILYIHSRESTDFLFPAEFIYSSITGSDKSIVIGPITPTITQIISNVQWITYSSTIFIMLLPLLGWIIPTWRSSGALQKVSQNFAKDDLYGRVKLIFCSNLNTTAKLFNRMADRLEYLLNRNKLLASAISHDLRTPISAMEFSLELLSSSDDLHSRRRHLDQIKTNLQSLSNMREELQLYAEFDRREIKLNRQLHPLHLWLSKHLAENWQDNRVSLSVSADALQVCCALDSAYLARAVDNLLSNGLRYAKTVLQITVTKDDRQCFISIENDGERISLANRLEVFEPFVRLDESRTKNSEGSGLGLSIVQQIMQWHAGSVRVEDSELGGAKFILSLPVVSATKMGNKDE